MVNTCKDILQDSHPGCLHMIMLLPLLVVVGGVLLSRERGARALEERLEMKKVAETPIIESAAAAAAAAAASKLPEVPGQPVP